MVIKFVPSLKRSSFVSLLSEFDKVYKRLDVTLIERGESFYNSLMPGVVAEFERKGKSVLCS